MRVKAVASHAVEAPRGEVQLAAPTLNEAGLWHSHSCGFCHRGVGLLNLGGIGWIVNALELHEVARVAIRNLFACVGRKSRLVQS